VSNTEVFFKGSTTLDNGITIGADIQLEGNSQAGDQIDESYAWIESSWGKVILGTENGVGDLITTHAPAVGPNGVDGSNSTFWVSNASSNNAKTSIDVSDSGDNEKITYISPKLLDMLQAGVSYTPSTDAEDGKAVSSTGSMSDVYEATVLLDTTVAGVGVRTSASYLHGNVSGTTGNRDSYSAGLSLSMAGFTLGGGYGRTIRKNNASDGWAYNIGLSYATGPYAVSLGYHHGEAEGTLSDNGSNEKYDTAELGFKYNVSSGIDFKSGVSYTKFSEDVELNERSGGLGEYESDGWVWVNGIYLSF
jgi:hypothetical protein